MQSLAPILNEAEEGLESMQLMTIEDLAEYLGDSKRTIYKYIKEGDCPPYLRISSKNIKFDKADVDRWLESKKVHPRKVECDPEDDPNEKRE